MSSEMTRCVRSAPEWKLRMLRTVVIRSRHRDMSGIIAIAGVGVDLGRHAGRQGVAGVSRVAGDNMVVQYQPG